MADRNGYFQICERGGDTYLHLIPPEGNGAKVDYKEVMDYLMQKDILFDVINLHDFLEKNADDMMFLCEGTTYCEQEMLTVRFEDDDLTAIVRFFPPFAGGALMDEYEIKGDLNAKGIVHGIDEEAIRAFIEDRRYCTDIVLAKGTPLVESTDAVIEYLFKTDLTKKPAANPDGSVDYKNLDTICKCAKGQVLARMTPAQMGQSGVNVLGKLIMPKTPRNVLFHYSNNISKSADGLELISDINGHVVLIDEKVFVSEVLEIKDVDASTGNIDFEGNVNISGTVRAGYYVKATGDIEIHGSVEDSMITAGGQVIVHRGINGMENGVIQAGSNVICKFIENAKVYAQGYVETDAIVNSYVSALSHIAVQGKKGFVVGSEVHALNYVEAKIFGSEMGVKTLVEVGINPEKKEKYIECKKTNKMITDAITRLEPVVKAMGEKIGTGGVFGMDKDELMKAKDLAKKLSEHKEWLRENTIEMTKLEYEMQQGAESFVKVTGQLYPGVVIDISSNIFKPTSTYHYCKFLLDNHEVVMKGL